jgi:uncharacterized protein
MKIVIAGGTGFLGSCLVEHYRNIGTQLIILTRGKSHASENIQYVNWDGKTVGPWAQILEGADVLINLNGKSVDCRYTEENRKLIYSTRLDATAALGSAIQNCKNPPKLWINAASATIYRHSLDKEMDEYTGEIGTGFSVDVCQKWESTFNMYETPQTRKVLIRTGIVLGKIGGALRPLKMLTKFGLGGRHGPGNQYFSWIHEADFVGIIGFIISNEGMSGAYNVTAPTPLPNSQIMNSLRRVLGIPFGLPLPKLLLEFGAVLIRTEPELILKSRRVVPKRLLQAGYKFQFVNIQKALADLCQ